MDRDVASGLAGIEGLSSLDDPVRRQLYVYVASSEEPVSREDAARAAGIGRTLAAYHLDKLAEVGLLAVSYARPAGKGGPGAGRPAKYYARTQREVAVSVPPRNYQLLARLLTEAIDEDSSGTVRDRVGASAYESGRATGRSASDVLTALGECGYEPASTDDDAVELRNCPFHQLAAAHTELVCGLNQRLLQGLLDGARARRAQACLDPQPGRCCVRIENLPAARTNRRFRNGRHSPSTAPSGEENRP